MDPKVNTENLGFKLTHRVFFVGFFIQRFLNELSFKITSPSKAHNAESYEVTAGAILPTVAA